MSVLPRSRVTIEELHKLIMDNPNDKILGSKIREIFKDMKIYEDLGDGHLIDSHLNELSQEDWTCEYCKKSTYYVDLDYIGNYTNHLSCELEYEISNTNGKVLKSKV